MCKHVLIISIPRLYYKHYSTINVHFQRWGSAKSEQIKDHGVRAPIKTVTKSKSSALVSIITKLVVSALIDVYYAGNEKRGTNKDYRKDKLILLPHYWTYCLNLLYSDMKSTIFNSYERNSSSAFGWIMLTELQATIKGKTEYIRAGSKMVFVEYSISRHQYNFYSN